MYIYSSCVFLYVNQNRFDWSQKPVRPDRELCLRHQVSWACPRSRGGGRGCIAECLGSLHLLQEVSRSVCVSVDGASPPGPDRAVQTIPQRVQLQDTLCFPPQVSLGAWSFSLFTETFRSHVLRKVILLHIIQEKTLMNIIMLMYKWIPSKKIELWEGLDLLSLFLFVLPPSLSLYPPLHISQSEQQQQWHEADPHSEEGDDPRQQSE